MTIPSDESVHMALINALQHVGRLSDDTYNSEPMRSMDALGIYDVITVNEQGTLAVVYVSDDALYVSVRGSVSVADWMSNAKALFRSDWFGVKAHRGFVDGARAVAPKLRSIINRHARPRVTFTGHSRGAAITYLLAILFEQLGENVECITYAQPRTISAGKQKREFQGRYMRVTNGSDAVVRWPKLGYGHRGDNFYMTNENDGYVINPSSWQRFKDRLFTFHRRGGDHYIDDYIEELQKCENWLLQRLQD